jgi:hypothetical protein
MALGPTRWQSSTAHTVLYHVNSTDGYCSMIHWLVTLIGLKPISRVRVSPLYIKRGIVC